MKKTAIVLLLVLPAVPLLGQQGRSGFSGFSLTTPAQIVVGTDNNFLVDRTPPDQKLFILSLPASVLPGTPDLRPLKLDDTVYLFKAPTLAFVSDSQKREFALTYQPEFELFQKNSDQNSWNHSASIDFSHLVTRRVQVRVGDWYRSSNDPSRTLQNVLLLLPRGRYQENAFRGSVSFNQTERTSYLVRYDHAASTFGQNDPLQRRVLDTISKGFSLTASHMLRRNHRLRVTYSAFSASPWNRRKVADEHVDGGFVAFKHPAHSVTGEYRFAVNPSTVFEFSGGGVKTDSGMNYVFGISGDRRVGSIWLGGGYSRSLSFFSSPQMSLPNVLGANSFHEVANARLRGQPARKVGIELSVSGSRSIYATLLGNSLTLMGRSRIDYRLSPRLVAFGSVETYRQNRNDYVETPLARTRLFAGLEFSFSSETSQRTSRLNRDTDNVALTEYGRQSAKPQQEE